MGRLGRAAAGRERRASRAGAERRGRRRLLRTVHAAPAGALVGSGLRGARRAARAATGRAPRPRRAEDGRSTAAARACSARSRSCSARASRCSSPAPTSRAAARFRAGARCGALRRPRSTCARPRGARATSAAEPGGFGGALCVAEHAALEREPGLPSRFKHVFVLDPPPFAHVDEPARTRRRPTPARASCTSAGARPSSTSRARSSSTTSRCGPAGVALPGARGGGRHARRTSARSGARRRRRSPQEPRSSGALPAGAGRARPRRGGALKRYR